MTHTSHCDVDGRDGAVPRLNAQRFGGTHVPRLPLVGWERGLPATIAAGKEKAPELFVPGLSGFKFARLLDSRGC
jgi:hypothetical protein